MRFIVALVLVCAACLPAPRVIVVLVPAAPSAGSASAPAPGPMSTPGISSPLCSIESVGADGSISCFPSGMTGATSSNVVPL